MDFKDCIKFANENRLCSFATIEGDQPRVRFIEMWHADDTGFYFQTETAKSFYTQIKNNKKVETSFIVSGAFLPKETSKEPDPTAKIVMRVTGEIEFIDDLKIKARILEDRPYLKMVIGIAKPDDPRLSVFRIYKGEAFFWSMANSTKESKIPRIKF